MPRLEKPLKEVIENMRRVNDEARKLGQSLSENKRPNIPTR